MRTIFKIIIPMSLVSIFCFSECKSRSGANTHGGSDISTSDIKIHYIEKEDMWCFTENCDTIDFFIELEELWEKPQIGLNVRYESSSGGGGLFTFSERSNTDTLVVSDKATPIRNFRVVDSQKQLQLLDIFIDSLSRIYNPIPLKSINWQAVGASDAIVKISNDYYNYEDPDVYSTLKNILKESELRFNLDSILSQHGFRVSDVIITEGIYYSVPIPESYSRVIDIPSDLTEILYFYTTFFIEPSHLTPTE